MDTPLQIIFILTSIVISITASSAPFLSPSQSQDYNHTFTPPPHFSTILSNLGFQELSTAASFTNSTTTPITIFAPTDSSLRTCPSCSLSLLLLEHSIRGLYPLHLLRKLAFGTKIETLADSRCLTITAATNATKVFVGGVEITRSDLFNDGHVIVHGIQGFVSHLSPLSCNIERMTSLSFPPSPPETLFFIMRLLLKDAMLRLRISGYSVLSLAMREKYLDLLDLKAMTVFALDDASIFGGGHGYISDLRFHIVPNRRLMAADLINLRVDTALPTMERKQKLVVTVAGGGGPMSPMRINHVKIRSLDLLYNNRIVVHGLSAPFARVPERSAVGNKDSGPTTAVEIGSGHEI